MTKNKIVKDKNKRTKYSLDTKQIDKLKQYKKLNFK